MFEFQGVWFRDGERHFPDWMKKNGEMVDGKGTYQIRKLRAAVSHCKNFRKAIDVGAHVGLWSMQLHKMFDTLIAFEPVEQYRKCWEMNCPELWVNSERINLLFPFALGAQAGHVSMKIPELDGGLDTGGTHVGGDGDIEMRTLDSFQMQYVDFIKIDCEGYEHHIIEGAAETIAQCRPCIIVEQKLHKLGPNFGIAGRPALEMLQERHGYKVVAALSGDFIMVPK